MPVTAKLSQELYNQLGDRVAGELVEWFNSVDLTYRTDLRELNELNFARFDAKMEQRIGAVKHLIDGLRQHVDARFTAQDARLEARFTKQEAWFSARLFDAAKWFVIAWITQTAAIWDSYSLRGAADCDEPQGGASAPRTTSGDPAS